MVPEVLVYSPHPTRGLMIEKTLAVAGIQADLRSVFFETEAVLRDRPPALAILDAKDARPEDRDRVLRLVRGLTETRVIILADSAASFSRFSLPPSVEVQASDRLEPAGLQRRSRAILWEARMRRARFIRRRIVHPLLKGIRRTARLAPAGLAILFTLLLGAGGGYVLWCVSTLPPIDRIQEYSPFESSRIFSSDSVQLSEFFVERRTFIPAERIPTRVKNAFVAAEDAGFYQHGGFDLKRMARALLINIKRGEVVQGGSTITQQLVKMLLLKPDRTLARKIREIVLAGKLEKRYSKDEILALYLNKVYFGSRAYGIEAAARIYFDKTTPDLTIGEAAFLAALPKAPSYYALADESEKIRIRRNYILQRMAALKFITADQAEAAAGGAIPRALRPRERQAPYFVDYCLSVLEKKYEDQIYTSGFRIYSSLDTRIQDLAERSIAKGIKDLKARSIDGVQAALLAVELDSGRILAMVGGTDFAASQFNRATQAKRQPGSTFKPFVYLTALNQGFKPDDPVVPPMPRPREDGPVGAVPDAAGGSEAGGPDSPYAAVSLQTALALSLNGPTMALARRVGLNNVFRTAHALGIQSPIHPFPASILGASEVTLLEMVYAYAALARGYALDPLCVDRIIDKKNAAVWEPRGRREKIIDDSVLSSIRFMLRQVVLWGTAREAGVLGRPVYGKTGTTNDAADAWFIGFDDRVVAGVWVGRDARRAIGTKENAATAALPIWIEFMKNLSGTPAASSAHPLGRE
jgi:penicillin-binding protein 1A